MPVEPPGYICDLDPTWPLGSDNVSSGDDHLRNFKKSVQDSFPNICSPVTATPEELNNAGKSQMPIVTTYASTGIFTHTFTPGRTWCRVTVTGGGGGGYALNAGLGGFAAGTSIKTTPITQTSAGVTVGSGGAVGAAGDQSEFSQAGGPVVNVQGGPAGVLSVDSGTSGSLGTGGDINIRGGGPGQLSASEGGGSYWASGSSTDAAGGLNNVFCFGAGGRGGSSTQGGRPGVAGVVYIEEY